MSGPHPSSLAAINGLSKVRNWSIDHTADTKTGASSASRQGVMRKKGIQSWTGKFAQWGADPTYMPGESFAFVGYKNSSTDVRNTVGIRSSGTVFIDQVSINWNWNSNEIISMESTFSGSGPVTHASGAAVLDSTVQEQSTPCATNVTMNGTTITDVTTAVLAFTCANLAAVSSSTNCWVERKRGPTIDFTVQITQYNDEGIAPGGINIGDDTTLVLPATATTSWTLKWCQLTGITGVVMDLESGAIIQQTLNFGFNAVSGTTLGQIRKPGGVSDWWPFT